jgi:energy-coupling factor transporter ATP-binding protein EcfA2
MIVGASGSGKTTLLEEAYKISGCIYIRQYHQLRPHLKINDVRNFDPSGLPYTASDTTRVGGTYNGTHIPGLSGGQRKMFIFELIKQRTVDEKDLLIVLDEPFAGVTDQFEGWIIEQLRILQSRHRILVVTNDHIDAIRNISDNVVTVSGKDRSQVLINGTAVTRQTALTSLTAGDSKPRNTSFELAEVMCFCKTELLESTFLIQTAVVSVFLRLLYVSAMWNPPTFSEPLLVIMGLIVEILALRPFVESLAAWRECVTEEADALVHSSVQLQKALMCVLVCVLRLCGTMMTYVQLQILSDGLSGRGIMFGIICESIYSDAVIIMVSLYSNVAQQKIAFIASIPAGFNLLLSTSTNPGGGTMVLKPLRYATVRFYLFCFIGDPATNRMEACPRDADMWCLLVSFLPCFVVGVLQIISEYKAHKRRQTVERNKRKSMRRGSFALARTLTKSNTRLSTSSTSNEAPAELEC